MLSYSSRAASVVFARKPNGTLYFCQEHRWLIVITQAVTQQSVELHVDQLVYETHGARCFIKLDLAMAYARIHSCANRLGFK